MVSKILLVIGTIIICQTCSVFAGKPLGHRKGMPSPDRELKAIDYDCSNKDDGNYVHPSDCTKFVACVGHQDAYEEDCAACNTDPYSCPTGKLHYDHPSDDCLWAYQAGCVTDPAAG